MLSKTLILLITIVFVLAAKQSSYRQYAGTNIEMRVREEGTFRCQDNGQRMVSIDRKYDECFDRKWQPLPPVPNFANERVCCYFLDRKCQFDQLIRDVCEVTDEMGFTQLTNDKVGYVLGNCTQSGFRGQISTTFCRSLTWNPVYDPDCQQYIDCRKELPVGSNGQTTGSGPNPQTGGPDSQTGGPDSQTGGPDSETGGPDSETDHTPVAPDRQTGGPDSQTGGHDSQRIPDSAELGLPLPEFKAMEEGVKAPEESNDGQPVNPISTTPKSGTPHMESGIPFVLCLSLASYLLLI